MPHITIDYSPNIEPEVNVQALCDCLRQAAAATEALPMAGVRVRAFAADYWSIADGDPAHGYVDISLRMRAGRSAAAKQEVTRCLFDAAQQFLAQYMTTRSLALSFETRDIDPDLSPKTGTIRHHLGQFDHE